MSSAIAQTNGTWAALLAQALIASAQVDEASTVDVVLSPGSRSTPLVLAFEACPRARLHNVLDERAAGFFALGLARARQQPAILLCTSGSAGTHWYPAVVEAAGSRVPLVLLTTDRPVELQACGAPQTMYQQQLFGEHVRLFADLGTPQVDGSPRFWQVRAAQALDAATGSVPGPVHLNVPFREPLWAPGVHALAEGAVPPPRVVRGAAQIQAESLEALSRRLSAGRGVIVCGPRSPDGGALARAVTELAARLQWPILAEPTSGLRFGAHDKHCVIAAGDALLRDSLFAADHAPSCVLRIGAMPTSKAMSQWLAQHGAGRTVLVEPSGQWLDPTLGVDTLLVAEPAALCRAVVERLPRLDASESSWLLAWRQADESAGAALRQACGEGFWGGAVVRELVDALPAGAGLHVASSMAVRDLDTFAPPRNSDTQVWCNRGTNGIDGTLACFLGAATAWQEAPAVALMGDLAFLHDVGALLLARALSHQSATVVVVNNQGGSIFDFLPIAAHPSAFAPHFRTPQEAAIGPLCAAAQVRSVRVISREGLRTALQESLARPGLDVIEAAVEIHAQPRYAAAWQAVRTAMAMTT